MQKSWVRRFVRLGWMPCLLLAGCATGWDPAAMGTAPDSRLITAGEIRHSGASNAWEVLAHKGIYIPNGDSPLVPPARTRRELANAPRVVVDGVPMLELRLLRDIPAHVISSIRILSRMVVIRTHE